MYIRVYSIYTHVMMLPDTKTDWDQNHKNSIFSFQFAIISLFFMMEKMPAGLSLVSGHSDN